jgi:hypothetical protein
MRWTSLQRLTPCAALLATLTLSFTFAVADDKKEDEGFTPIFNGKDLTGWKIVLQKNANPARTWQVKDGTLVCTGRPHGFCYTDKSYKNYVVKFEWKYKRPENLNNDEKFTGTSGLLVHIQEPTKSAVQNTVWPRCVEVHCANQTHGKTFTLGCCEGKYVFDPDAQREVRKPVGDWNVTEVVCKDGTISVTLNGTEVATGKGELKEGPFGFQSDGAEIHLRNIRVKELADPVGGDNCNKR